jgi:hypothetical protein
MPVTPDREVADSFALLYPAAGDVRWDFKDNNYIATFTLPSGQACAWFGNGGEWLMSVREQPPEGLHREVASAFDGSVYAAWEIKSVNVLERLLMGDVYVLSVSENNRRADVYYSQFGDLIRVDLTGKAVHAPIDIPPEISRTVDSLFNDPEIIDLWENDLSVNAAVLDDAAYRFVAFTAGYDWLCTLRDIAPESIPPNVRDAFDASAYGDCIINRTQILHSPSDSMYVIHFPDHSQRSHMMCIKTTGLLHCIISY